MTFFAITNKSFENDEREHFGVSFGMEWGAMQHLHGNKRNRMYFIVARRVLQ